MCEEVAPKQPWHHAELFKKEDLMPDVDASLCEGKGAEENTHQEEAMVQERWSLSLLKKKLKPQVW